MKYVLIDAKHMLYRAYYSSPGYSNPNDMEPTRNFLRLIAQTENRFGDARAPEDAPYQQPALYVCWDPPDSGAERKKLFPSYKAERVEKATPERLAEKEQIRVQQRLAQRVLDQFEIVQLQSPGWEADDTLGTLATNLAKDPNAKVTIVTGDRDLLSCCSDRVQVARPIPGDSLEYKIETPETVVERWGVLPERFGELKALIGDTSDNIPGAKGIGEKKAGLILKLYPDVVRLVELARGGSDLAPLSPSIKKAIVDSADNILLSRKLVEINRAAPLEDVILLVQACNRPEWRQRAKKAYDLCKFQSDDLFNQLCRIGGL